MTASTPDTLPIPILLRSDSDRSPSPSPSPSPVASRNPSRSPQPYRRSKGPYLQSPPRRSTYPPSPALTPSPKSSRAATLLQPSYGGSESGTEADDELTKRLTAPPTRRRISSSDEVWDEEGQNAGSRRRSRNELAEKKSGRPIRLKFAFLRRGIEVGLAVVLAAVVLFGKAHVALSEVFIQRKEILYWLVPFLGVVVAYPIRILLRTGSIRLPKSLDPAALLYPTLFPVLIALSLTSAGSKSSNPFLIANLVISLSNLPPLLSSSWDFHWLLSLAPLLSSGHSSVNDTLSLIAPINATLTYALTDILHPSLTSSELRLLSSALINLLFHATSPQAIILRALLWGGGMAVFLLCENVIKWNVSLARVPFNRFRSAGKAIIGIGRLRTLAGLKEMAWKKNQQASESEGEILVPTKQLKPRNPSFYATLTRRQAAIRRWSYAGAVYLTVFGIVMLGLRPYIARYALDGMDPFIWAPAYILCGQEWYQNIIDHINPGMGYCVTEGSTEAANVRLGIIGFWAVILTTGLTFITIRAPHLEVDTRRKVFHGMVIPMFIIPGLFDPPFTHLCLSLAVAIFLLCDLIRAGQLPPASKYIAQFLEPYVDGRDLKGPMVVSHVFLLVGAGIGWWLTLAAHDQKGWDWNGPLELSFSSGVVCVGMGDAAASLIGRRFGKHKWGWKGGKSLEGSLAFTVAVVFGLSIARLWIAGVDGDWSPVVWAKLIFVGAWGSMLEAVATGVNDNVVVPVGVWMAVRGMGL